MPRDTFLFVPYRNGRKDGNDNSLTHPDVSNSDARSHAAAVSRRRRELNARIKGQLNTTVRPVLHSPTSSPTSSQSDEQDAFSTTSTNHDDKSPSSSTREQRRQNMRTMQFSWRAGTTSTNENSLSKGLRNHPSLLSPSTNYVHSVIEYYTQVISPVNHPIYAIFDVTNVYTSFFFDLLQHEDYHPAGMAMVGAIMQKVSNPNGNSLDNVRKNQAKAIIRLQNRWKSAMEKGENPADDIAIIIVVALASLARFLGDLNAYKVHRKNMGDMVNSRGGLDRLGHDGLTECVLMQWDSFWVFSTDGNSLFPDSQPPQTPIYPVFPLSSEMRNDFQKLPTGFQSLVIQGKVSVALAEILARAADAASFGIDSLLTGNIYHTQHRRYRDFVQACPCLGAPDLDEPNLEKQLCLALLLYCANAFTTARTSTALYGGAKMELTRIISRHEQIWRTRNEEECAFWICLVCVDSWRVGQAGSALHEQGQALLPLLKANQHSTNYEKILQKFFWTDELIVSCKSYLEMPG